VTFSFCVLGVNELFTACCLHLNHSIRARLLANVTEVAVLRNDPTIHLPFYYPLTTPKAGHDGAISAIKRRCDPIAERI